MSNVNPLPSRFSPEQLGDSLSSNLFGFPSCSIVIPLQRLVSSDSVGHAVEGQ